MIVLTGGPGAGKTAVLELVKKELCSNIAVLPEAAGVIFGGGFWRHDTVVGKKAAQRAIFHVQREAERLAREEGDYSLILCDRGTVDGVAYWPETAESYWREFGRTKEEEFGRYSAVIHLHTPGLHMGYNRSNPIRIETASQAAEIDKRIVEAWAGHPNRHFINNSHDFLEKAMRAIAIIRDALPYQCTKTLTATEPA
jgi:predicted ATPase